MNFEQKEPTQSKTELSALQTHTSAQQPGTSASTSHAIRYLCLALAVVLIALVTYGSFISGQKSRAAQAHLATAEKFYNAGEFERAISSYRKVMELSPEWQEPGRQWIEMAQGRQWLVHNSLPAPVVVLGNEARDQQKLEHISRSLLAAGRYAQLESMEQQLLKSRATAPDGQWELETFYGALSTPGDKSTTQTHLETQARTWARRRPNSITASVVLAHTLIEKAWAARGLTFASGVKPKGWQGFDHGLAQARQVLEDSRNSRGSSPGWYRASQSVAQGQGWSKKEYAAITSEALKQFPGYFHFQSAHAVTLLPRWKGRPGEWEQYVAAQADTLGGEAGDILYARLAWRVEVRASNALKESSLAWSRIDKGFQALMRRYPRSLHVASGYCFVAGRFKQFAVMQRLFKQNIRDQIDLDVWGQQKYFIDTRSWAFGETSN